MHHTKLPQDCYRQEKKTPYKETSNMVQASTDPMKDVVLSSPLKGCSCTPEGAAQKGGWPWHHQHMDVKPELQTHQG